QHADHQKVKGKEYNPAGGFDRKSPKPREVVGNLFFEIGNHHAGYGKNSDARRQSNNNGEGKCQSNQAARERTATFAIEGGLIQSTHQVENAMGREESSQYKPKGE